MKAIYTLLLALIVCYTTNAQSSAGNAPNAKTKTIKEKRADHTLKYSVLQDNPTVYHGPYVMEGTNWKGEGRYENGERVGIWSFTGFNGMTNYKFDFTTKEVLQSMNLVEEAEVYLDGQYVKMEVGNGAFMMGGDGRVLAHLIKNIRYPRAALNANAQGLVVLALEINEAGEISGIEVKQSQGESLDKEALRVARSLPNEWIPAMVGGKPVKSKHMLPVRFTSM